MEKKKSPFNGPVVKRLGEILQDSDGLLSLVKLNFLFIFTCIPFLPFISVFTCGGAVTAMLSCMNTIVRKGYLPDVKNTYMGIFKNNVRKCLPAGAVLYLLTAILSFDVFYYLSSAGNNIFYIPVASASLLALIVLWSVSVHLFSISDKNSSISKDTVFFAAKEALLSMGKTLTAVIISGIYTLCLLLFFPASLPLWLTIGFSVPMLAAAFAYTTPEW